MDKTCFQLTLSTECAPASTYIALITVRTRKQIQGPPQAEDSSDDDMPVTYTKHCEHHHLLYVTYNF